MEGREIRRLGSCAALAAGEICAACVPKACEAWPVFAIAAVWTVLMGYGFAVRGWRYAFLALLGAVLFYGSTVDSERLFREKPWMRNVRQRRVTSCASSLKRDFSYRVGIGLDHDREAAVLNRAILLGERDRIPRATKRTFVESGTIHVFAISGLHVTVIAKVLMFVVALAFVPYRFQGAVALVPVWGYVALVGFPPSAIRAALMASLYFLAPLFGRRSNGVIAWSQAFLVVHVLFPGLIADAGSQLSHVVMLAILLAVRVSRGEAFVAFAAWAAGVPIAAMEFGRITPGGLLANLVLIATAVYSVVAGTIGALASYIWKPFAVHFNNLSALLTDAMLGLSEGVARLPGSNFEIAPWGPLTCAAWYVAFALFLYLAHRIRLHRNLV